MSESLARIQNQIREWPAQPGVYLMRDSASRILYVGKAKNLRNRIRSYFQNPDANEGKTRLLVKRVTEVEFTVTPSELDALLLECTLIKKHRPRYNIRLKDDKNFPYVVLDFTHPFPVFHITRRVVLSPNLRYFGPFSAGVNEISRFLAKTFQLRDCSEAKYRNRTRPCLNYEIGTCTAPCVGLVSQESYARQVREATLFLKGRKQELIRELKAEMATASRGMEYERAKTLRDRIVAVDKLTEKQNAVLTERQKDIDILGSQAEGEEIQWVILYLRGGFLAGRRAARVTVPAGPADEATVSFLEQLYADSLVPDEIWIAAEFTGRADLEALLGQRAGKPVRILVKRGEKPMRLLGMAQENARLLLEQGAGGRAAASASEELRRALDLAEAPHSIEGMDVSNLQGTSPSVAVVHFADERPLKSRYRTYHPRTVDGQNDFAMLHEVVLRRYRAGAEPPPDLLLIDGGKGQLNAALAALEELRVQIPICALAKSRAQRAFTRKEIVRSEERVFVPGRKNPLALKENSAAMHLLQRVRDEAHRFSVKGHRSRRKKAALEDGFLSGIRGIGPKIRIRLLRELGGMEGLRAADLAALRAAGVPAAAAMEIRRRVEESSGAGEE